MKLAIKPGLAAGLAVLALAAPAAALAGPTVRVRVEGASGTLLERTTVTLPDTPPPVTGGACPAGSAAAALEIATGGNWSRAPFVTAVLGEVHDGPYYWAEWVDGGSGYKLGQGVCSDALKAGDELLMVADDVPPLTNGSLSKVPLELHAPHGVRGADLSVLVTGAVVADFSTPATSVPVEGATVSGGGVTAVTGPGGRAVLRFDRSGPVRLRATQPGSVPSAAETILVTDAPPAPAPAAGGSVADRAAPAARLLGIRDHQVFAKGKGPRTLRATAPDPSGLAAVKLRLTRRASGRCAYFSGRRADFARARCGRAFFFKVGSDPSVSYLLPERPGPGRYVLDLAAVDRAGNRSALARGSTRVMFTVR